MISIFRPNLPEGVTIGRNGTDRVLEVVAALLLLTVWGLCVYIYCIADGPIAVHFNFAGHPNRWGSASELFIFAGIVTLAMGIMGMAAYNPKMVNLPIKLKLERLSQQYTLMGRFVRLCNVVLGVMFVFIMLSMGSSFWGMESRSFVSFVLLLIVVLFGLIGYYSIRINRC